MGRIKVIYEDNHIIVTEKPPGILSQADGKDHTDMLTETKKYIKKKYNKPGDVYLALLHRLDKPVGGLMVFARTSKAASRLNEQMRSCDISKYYLAVINGTMRSYKGTLKGFIRKDKNSNISRMCDKNEADAKYAELDYEIVDTKENYSLLKIELLTGRSHQIRVQLSDVGSPIVGDRKYGVDMLHHTVALWAYKLRFLHPTIKEDVIFVSLPENKGIWEKFEYGEVK